MRYLLILLLVCSCATAKKKAIELSEQGRHEEAIEFWAEALKKDPDDEEIQNGLQSSLDFVSNDRLTRIRDKRLANNLQEAVDELRGLVELQKKYKIKLDFNSSSFQGKEVLYTWPYYKSTIRKKLKDNLSLGAESDQRYFVDVYNSMGDFNVLQAEVTKEGQAKCQELKNLPEKRPFFRNFTNQFCQYFKAKGEGRSEISTILFSKVELKAHIDNVHETDVKALDGFLNKALSETPWFHAEGTLALPMKISGRYKWIHKTEYIPQAHNYTEKVPYTEYVNVTKTRQIPYTEVVGGVAVQRYRTEEYRDSSPVTKFRKVARVYEYTARKNTLEMNLSLDGFIRPQKEYPTTFQKSVKEDRILHDLNLPEIGLYPRKEDVSNPMTKFGLLSQDFAQEIKKELNSIWEKNYCQRPDQNVFAVVAESAIRCQRLPQYPEAFVDQWFKTSFGVTGERSLELLGY